MEELSKREKIAFIIAKTQYRCLIGEASNPKCTEEKKKEIAQEFFSITKMSFDFADFFLAESENDK